MNPETLTLTDAAGNAVAELVMSHEDDGWHSGRVRSLQLPAELKEALDWYDEVVENQMLSYLDQALAAVERWGLRVRFRDGLTHPFYSLHISRSNDVSFRVTPVPPSAACDAVISRPVRG